ncbi:hypothetical protein DK926_24430 [Rhodococcus sp. Eu-32]|uniref:Rv2732c family membrane protein n=1 Tax=Rhodococcus sp. Eu-32 TaxID=1017319 RepID=UPI000DF3F3E6|nr:hypothetical protein [Rhodococcus sp. Eu-32]RRQ25225.1 hypothetical protein DK926_24430 [Rhodococcus sp. Eu-32]
MSSDRRTPDNTTPDGQKPDYDTAERRIDSEIDPGVRAVVVAVLVLVLLGTLALPHAGGATGFDVLSGNSSALGESIALPSRIFEWFVLVFGIVFSVLALVTRIWALAWAALCGSAVACVFGMLSIWSRQTLPSDASGGGPGIGLIVAWIAVLLLTFHWLKAVWNKTTAQLEAQERRRRAATEAEQNSQWAGPVLGRPTDRKR